MKPNLAACNKSFPLDWLPYQLEAFCIYITLVIICNFVVPNQLERMAQKCNDSWIALLQRQPKKYIQMFNLHIRFVSLVIY